MRAKIKLAKQLIRRSPYLNLTETPSLIRSLNIRTDYTSPLWTNHVKHHKFLCIFSNIQQFKCSILNDESNYFFQWFQENAVHFSAYFPWLATSVVDVAPTSKVRSNQAIIQLWAHRLICCVLPHFLRGQFADDIHALSVKKTPNTVGSCEFRLLWILLRTIYIHKLSSTCIFWVSHQILIKLCNTAYNELGFIL
jgi:hypothetical protein